MTESNHLPVSVRPDQVFQYCRCGAVREKRWNLIAQVWEWEPWHVCKGCYTGMDCREKEVREE